MELSIGYYANIFPVELLEDSTEVMVIKRSNYPDLRPLRDEIEKNNKKVYVYAIEDRIYGYGKDMNWLSFKGFTPLVLNLYNTPRLTGRMILEGIIYKTKQKGFVPLRAKEKGRYRLFNWNQFKQTSDGKVNVFTGYDIRVIFFENYVEKKLNFGVVVDVSYTTKDSTNRRLNPQEITMRFGNNTLKEVRQIQKDLIPTGINREVARQKLIEDIIPFVQGINQIKLPCGIEAIIRKEPYRIILGDSDESIR